MWSRQLVRQRLGMGLLEQRVVGTRSLEEASFSGNTLPQIYTLNTEINAELFCQQVVAEVDDLFKLRVDAC